MKKIIVHDDLDGVVSAVLLVKKVAKVNKIIFSSGNKKTKVDKNTIIADLPLDPRCGLWFDHHISNKTNKKFKGSFKLKKSCARVIYDYYKGKFPPFYKKLVEQLDKADSGDFSLEDIKNEDILFQLNYTLLLFPFKSRKENTIVLGFILTYLNMEVPLEEIAKEKRISKLLKNFQKLTKDSLNFIKEKAKIRNNIMIVDSSDKKRTFNPFKIFEKYNDLKFLILIRKLKHGYGFLIIKSRLNNFKQKSNIGNICKKHDGGGHKEIGGLQTKNKSKTLKELISKLN